MEEHNIHSKAELEKDVEKATQEFWAKQRAKIEQISAVSDIFKN